MKELLLILAFCPTVFALQAPYLISAAAQSDSSITVTWRNHDIATKGFIVLRKDSTELNFNVIDSLTTSTAATYTDQKAIRPSTLYTYKVMAFNENDISESSNLLQVVTLRAKPFLFKAVALGQNSVCISWSDKNKQSKGYIVQRKDSVKTEFAFVDSARTDTSHSYIDSFLHPGYYYTYRVIAFDISGIQDTSNETSVATIKDTFAQPSIYAYWTCNSNSVQISITDKSNCEKGFRIYRDDNFASAFNLLTTIVSSHPDSMGIISWTDDKIEMNKWYTYRVDAYKDDSVIASEKFDLFTLHSVLKNHVIKFQKLSDFPISFGGFSAEAGDSIIVKENLSPGGKFTVINVKDPLNPSFGGYLDTNTLLSFPLQTLIPVYLKLGLSNNDVALYKNDYFVRINNKIKRYKIQNDSLLIADSLVTDSVNRFYLFNDSLLSVIGENSWKKNATPPYGTSETGDDSYLYNFLLSDSGGATPFPKVLIDSAHSYDNNFMGGYSSGIDTESSYIHGYLNGTVLISNYSKSKSNYVNNLYSKVDSEKSTSMLVLKGTHKYSIFLENCSNNCINNFIHPSNTGCYLSPTENLCVVDNQLFASDISYIPDGFDVASANNSIYSDGNDADIKNIVVDTLKKRIFLFYQDKLSILNYKSEPVGIAGRPNTPQILKQNIKIAKVAPCNIKIDLPDPSQFGSSDLFIYDLSGCLIDKLSGVKSKFILWKPSVKSGNCYIITIRNRTGKNAFKYIMN